MPVEVKVTVLKKFKKENAEHKTKDIKKIEGNLFLKKKKNVKLCASCRELKENFHAGILTQEISYTHTDEFFIFIFLLIFIYVCVMAFTIYTRNGITIHI